MRELRKISGLLTPDDEHTVEELTSRDESMAATRPVPCREMPASPGGAPACSRLSGYSRRVHRPHDRQRNGTP